MVDSGSEFLGREFCAEHDSLFWAIVGRLAVLAFFIILILWFAVGLYTECTVTDPEYFYSR